MSASMEKSTIPTKSLDPSVEVADASSTGAAAPDLEGVDIALEWFEEVRKIPASELEAESAAVRRRTDWILMPTICWTYALQFLDNAVLGYAYAYGMIADTGMTNGDYNWLASIYYFGYLFVSATCHFSEMKDEY